MVQLASRRVAQRAHDLGDRPARREAGGKARLEARSGREWRQRRAQDRGSVDQRRQLWPDGRVATGQEAIDGLI